MGWKRMLLKWINLWPPFLFSGIKVTRMDTDMRRVEVKLKLRFWNANYVGTQFGGSIFAMADPFYMLMLIENLGPAYSVWDKATEIAFLKPGRTDLTAEFVFTEEELVDIRRQVDKEGRLDLKRLVEIRDAAGEIVARIHKTISIKLRTKVDYPVVEG